MTDISGDAAPVRAVCFVASGGWCSAAVTRGSGVRSAWLDDRTHRALQADISLLDLPDGGLRLVAVRPGLGASDDELVAEQHVTADGERRWVVPSPPTPRGEVIATLFQVLSPQDADDLLPVDPERAPRVWTDPQAPGWAVVDLDGRRGPGGLVLHVLEAGPTPARRLVVRPGQPPQLQQDPPVEAAHPDLTGLPTGPLALLTRAATEAGATAMHEGVADGDGWFLVPDPQGLTGSALRLHDDRGRRAATLLADGQIVGA